MKTWTMIALAIGLFTPLLVNAQTSTGSTVPAGFTIRLDAPEEPAEKAAPPTPAKTKKGKPEGQTKLKTEKSKSTPKGVSLGESGRTERAATKKASATAAATNTQKSSETAPTTERKVPSEQARPADTRTKRRARVKNTSKRRGRSSRKAKRVRTARTKKPGKAKQVKRRQGDHRKKPRRTARKRKKAKATPPELMLNGTGESFARKTEWGMVEAVDRETAARIRAIVRGRLRTHGEPVGFDRYRAHLGKREETMLAAVADYIKSSQDVLLVLAEGHAQDYDTPARDHGLSEARASAVREFLINRGVAPNRVIAYGLGNLQPLRDPSTGNRRVQVHLVSGEMVYRPASKVWNEIAVVQVAGGGLMGASGAAAGEPTPVAAKAQLTAPFRLETDEQTRALLRSPNASTFQLQPDTEVHVDVAHYGPVRQHAAMSLRRGKLNVLNAPRGEGRGTMRLELAQLTLAVGHGELVAHADDHRNGWIKIVNGQVSLQSVNGLSLELGPGQIIQMKDGKPSIWTQIDAPRVLTSIAIQERPKILEWQPVPKAVAYRIDAAADIHFHAPIEQKTTLDMSIALSELVPTGERFFWRITGIDERGIPGKTSQIFEAKAAPKAPPR